MAKHGGAVRLCARTDLVVDEYVIVGELVAYLDGRRDLIHSVEHVRVLHRLASMG